MAKWKCEICGNEFDNFHAQGFDNKIYCPLCYFKKLYNDTELEREKLQKQLQQKDNIIKEVREYIKRKDICIDTRKTDGSMDYVDLEKELLEILDKGEK